jgi:hypothetical protein
LNAGNYEIFQTLIVQTTNNATGPTVGFSASWANLTIKNSGSFGFPTVSDGWASGNNNAASHAVPFGTSNQASLVYADQFENPNAGSGTHDFRLKTGSSMFGTGVDLSASVSTDITGTAFSVPYDIGVWAVGVTTVIYNDVLSDSATAGESFSVSLVGSATMLDSATTGESFAAVLTAGAAVSDAATSLDSLAVGLVISFALSDPALAMDVFAAGMVVNAAHTDQTNALDTLAARMLAGVEFSDSANPTDRFSTAVYISSAFSVICARVGYPLFSLEPGQMARVEEARHTMFVVTSVQATTGEDGPGLAITISEVPAAVIELTDVKNSRC